MPSSSIMRRPGNGRSVSSVKPSQIGNWHAISRLSNCISSVLGRETGFMLNPVSERVSTERRFQLLVEAVTDYAICLIDPRGFVASWNAGAQRIKGYSADEIIGRHFSEFFTEADREAGKPQRALDTALRTGRFEDEGLRTRQDGSRFSAAARLEAV